MALEACGWTPEEVVTAEGRVTKSNAAVHDGPGAECDVTRHLALNSGIEIFCVYFNDFDNRWYYTTLGWVYGNYVTITRTSQPGGLARC
ncbi:hypothetical protein OOK43_31645 [[Kitasatospora] papulosa]|uniref:hypothetical protein n=1 Tax=Streptomyces TaxID=1883 RepID=UPI00224E4A73|nr:hypothetical protein [[Kitasatospora] papulosa]MCX4417795.1 hypothetical protein [[Kitasatospora] papulosa]